jgi:transcriptional regulator with XRE-family HTH domain
MRSMQAPEPRQPPPNRLEELREARGLKRVHLAAAFDVDQSTIFRWERNGGIPDEAKLRLAEFFEVNPAYLMGWIDHDSEPVAA